MMGSVWWYLQMVWDGTLFHACDNCKYQRRRKMRRKRRDVTLVIKTCFSNGRWTDEKRFLVETRAFATRRHLESLFSSLLALALR